MSPVTLRKSHFAAVESIFTRNGATDFFISQSLEMGSDFRANIKPAYQRRISNSSGSRFGFTLSFLFAMGCENQREDLQPTAYFTTRRVAVWDSCCRSNHV